jgi:hypothetical protein
MPEKEFFQEHSEKKNDTIKKGMPFFNMGTP